MNQNRQERVIFTSLMSDTTGEFSETDIFRSLCQADGVDWMEKSAARAALIKRCQAEPAWIAVLPESLLVKLGFKHDRVFSDGDVALAAAVHGHCVRRILPGGLT